MQTDVSLHRHAEELAGDPVVDAFAGMSMDERWVRRSPEEMLRTFPWFDCAGFDLLIDELPPGSAIVEGFRRTPLNPFAVPQKPFDTPAIRAWRPACREVPAEPRTRCGST
ncbi:hypothetical protein [uncultured Amnibacterium sp.]|uniref:hypothetical protein n=1 Tax=uncultured Amnibacterium sp. TaxID=1631851 RepID=UPI0035C98DEB